MTATSPATSPGPAVRTAGRHEPALAATDGPTRLADVVDGCFLALSGAAATWLGYLLLRDGVRPGWPALLLVAFWGYFSYLVLPRLHRILTRLYVPGYFVGRARTSDGLLSDPVNVALLGDEAQVHDAMTTAGWTRADDLDLRSGRRIVLSTLRRQSYPAAPVSPLHLFDREQDFAYQQEVAGNPARRHHVRFWRCPEGWLLPGGFPVHWLAAATYDRKVGLSLFTLQVTHKIDADVDAERDFVVDSVTRGQPAVSVDVIERFSSGYHSRTGGGDRVRTDGDLPIIDLRAVPHGPRLPAPATDSRDRRPAPLVAGATIAVLRSLVYVGVALLLLLAPGASHHWAGAGLDDAAARHSAAVLAGTLLVAAVVDTGLAAAVLDGRNWARVWLMTVSAVTALTAFAATIRPNGSPVGLPSMPGLAASILVLLALSSHRAREYATRRRGSARSRT